MTTEYCRLANAPMYLDRADLERYQLIIVRTGFRSFAEVNTCILLMRVLKLENRPDVILLSDDMAEISQARTTDLRQAYCLQTNQATPARLGAIFEEIVERAERDGLYAPDGAPEIPGYVIQRPLAATYSSTVYLAYSEERETDVVLKICPRKSENNAYQHRLSLEQEYGVMRKLGGSYVAEAYDFGYFEGLSYCAMEYVDNGSISTYLGKNARKVSRVDLMKNVAKGLRQIHKAGYLHLDVKPNNVMIRENGSPVFIDFGISKRILAAREQSGRTFSLGSPYFMSPEQTRGEALDERSDIYSFGALWFRVFTGHTPFIGSTFAQLSLARSKRAPSMGDALKAYQPIVDRTLAVNPDDRFSSAQELIDEIENYSTSATGIHRAITRPDFEAQVLASANGTTPHAMGG